MKVKVIEEIIENFNPEIERHVEISKKEYRERWQRVQNAMKEKGYDLAFACGSELDRSDIAWLAGIFDPIIERYGILIPAEGTPLVIAGSEGGHVIEDCIRASDAQLALLREYQISDEDYRFAQFEKLEDVVNKLVPYAPESPSRLQSYQAASLFPMTMSVYSWEGLEVKMSFLMLTS